MQSKLTWRRVGYVLSFLTVAGVAARVSYSHIRDVALHGHQPAEVAALLPLAVDPPRAWSKQSILYRMMPLGERRG